MTSTKLKAAWIRDDVPANQSASGHFDCECGRQVRSDFILDKRAIIPCECGILYRNDGWKIFLKDGDRVDWLEINNARIETKEGYLIWRSSETDLRTAIDADMISNSIRTPHVPNSL